MHPFQMIWCCNFASVQLLSELKGLKSILAIDITEVVPEVVPEVVSEVVPEVVLEVVPEVVLESVTLQAPLRFKINFRVFEVRFYFPRFGWEPATCSCKITIYLTFPIVPML